jgi:aconitate hydratase
VFAAVDKDFAKRAKAAGSGVIVAGDNYGQGSSREHAALGPKYLGVKAVIAKSFARIHLANLINFGIIPFTFTSASDYEAALQGATFEFRSLLQNLKPGKGEIQASLGTKPIKLAYELTSRQIELIFTGGLLNWIKNARG